MMKYIKFACSLLITGVVLTSCNDDDFRGNPEIPIRDAGEVLQESADTIISYLENHSYNYEEFQNPPEGFDYKIRFSEIENDSVIPLANQVIRKTLTRDSLQYDFYILKVRKGAGPKPHFADSIYLNYEGYLYNGRRFDFSTNPVWFDLSSAAPGAFSPILNAFRRTGQANANAIDGFANAINEFGTASQVSANDDGTVSYSNDYGIGAIFVPTGMAYFNQGSGSIPPYADLIFTLNLIASRQTDHDNDGIPSYMEDLTEDLLVRHPDNDTDSDGIFNYLDPDDDGDGIPTREEIIINEDGSLEFPDSNGNGIPDYLDPES